MIISNSTAFRNKLWLERHHMKHEYQFFSIHVKKQNYHKKELICKIVPNYGITHERKHKYKTVSDAVIFRSFVFSAV